MERQSKLKCDVPAVCFDLYGNRFFVALDERTADCCMELLGEAQARLDELQSGREVSKRDERETCRFLCGGLDRILGKDATRRTLGKGRRSIHLVAGLMCFVLNELGGTE